MVESTLDNPTVDLDLENGCTSCGEGDPKNECPHSRKACGHHCNHSWSHDECCWCGETWGDETKDNVP